MSWKRISDNDAKVFWDKTLNNLPDCNLFQSYKWGEYNKSYGQKIERWAYYNKNKEIISLLQTVVYEYPGILILLGWGGPVGDFSSRIKDLPKAILENTNKSNLYLRIFPHKSYNKKDEENILAVDWHRPKFKIHSGLSMFLDISKDEEYLLSKFSKNWKRNLNRSKNRKLDISLWKNPDSNEIYDLNIKLAESKGIDKLKIWPKSEILTNKLLKAFDDKIIMYRCFDNYGNVIAFRGYAYNNEIALDLFSVAVGEGRKNYASYYLLWTLIKDAKSKGIKYYDLNGIDGYEGGVYNFKKGTGAEPIKYLGAFEWSTSKYLRIFCDFVRYRKIKKI